jgi:hypothetical protein
VGVGGIEAPPATTGEGLSLRLRGGARGEGEGSAEGARGEAGEAGEAAEGAGTAESTHGVFTNAGRTARRNYTQHQWGLLGGHGGYLDHAIHTLDVEAGRVPARRGHDAFALVPTQSGATVGVSWVECAACEPSGEPPPPPPEAPVLPPYWQGHEPPAPMQVEPALPAAVPPAVHPPLVPVPATGWNVGRIQPDTHLSPDIASTLTIMSARMKVGCALYLYDFPPKVHDTPNVWTKGRQVRQSAGRRACEFVQRETDPGRRWPLGQRVSLAQSIMSMAVTMHSEPIVAQMLLEALIDRNPPGTPRAAEVSHAALCQPSPASRGGQGRG